MQTGVPRRPTEYFEACGAPRSSTSSAATPGSTTRRSRSTRAGSRATRRSSTGSVEQATTPNGVFGGKVMWGYFNGFVDRCAGSSRERGDRDARRARRVFPDLHYVWVTREDKVGQAISLWKAIQTWTWRAGRRRRLAARPRAALQLRRHRPPGQAAGARRGRVAPVLRPRRACARTPSSTSSSSSGTSRRRSTSSATWASSARPATPSASGGCGGRRTRSPRTGRSGTGRRRSGAARAAAGGGCRIRAWLASAA